MGSIPFFLSFLALVATASADATCKVMTSGQYQAFDGTNIRGSFPPNCYVPLAASDCGTQKWLVVFQTSTQAFFMRYLNQVIALNPGQTVVYPGEVTVAVRADQKQCNITIPQEPSTVLNCTICTAYNFAVNECVTFTPPPPTTPEIVTTPSPSTPPPSSTEAPSSEAPSSLAQSSQSPSSLAPIFNPGFCVFSINGSYTSFDGTDTDGSFPSDCVVPLAASSCESDAEWQVVFNKATSTCSVVYEGVITTLSNGGLFFEKSLIVFVFGDNIFIILLEQPTGVDCSVCSKPGLSECIAFPSPAPFSPIPTTAPFSTLVPILPGGFCMVKTSGIQYRAYDGTEIRGNFPADCVIPLASSDCGSEKAWQIVLDKATGDVLIISNGETTPLTPGTVFFTEDFAAFIFGDTVFIIVPQQPTDGDCSVCSAPGIPDCVSLPGSSGTSPSIGSSPSELPSSLIPSSVAPSSLAPSSESPSSVVPILNPGFCIFTTNGSYTSFDGTETDGSFPSDCVVPLAASSCSSDAEWQVVFDKATSACSVVYEGVITTLSNGGLFFEKSLIVFVFGDNVFIIVPEQPAGVDCSVCSKPGLSECIAFPSLSPFSPRPSSAPFSTLVPILPGGFCMVKTSGIQYRAYDGTEIRGNFPADCVIPLASSDCGSDKAWQIVLDKATGEVLIIANGETTPLQPGTVFVSDDFAAFVFGDTVFIIVPEQPTDGDCSICSAPGIPDCVSLPTGTPPSIGSSPSEFPSSALPSSPSGTPPTIEVSPSGSPPSPSPPTIEFSPSGSPPSPFPVSPSSPSTPVPGFCEISANGQYKAFDGTMINGNFPSDCVIPLASSDCSSEKAWQVILDKATDSVYIISNGETSPLAPGAVFIGDGFIVLIADSTVFVIVEDQPQGVDCSICSSPGNSECLNVSLPSGTPPSFSSPGTRPSSEFSYSTLLSTIGSTVSIFPSGFPSSLPPCASPGVSSTPPSIVP